MSDFTFTFHFHALEKEMVTHSSVLAWRIPGPGEPGGLPSMGSHRVGHNWSDLAAAGQVVTLLPFYSAYHFLCKYTGDVLMLPDESRVNWRVNRQLCTYGCKRWGPGEHSLSEGRCR